MQATIFKRIKWFYQRGRHGWADCDTWSFDSYLSRVIAEGISHLRRINKGTPSGLLQFDSNMNTINEEESNREWIAILDKISHAFQKYHDIQFDFSDNQIQLEEEVEKELNEAFPLLQKWFGALWD